MLTVHCPGCGRAIPVHEDEVGAIVLTCARCETRFMPEGYGPDEPGPARAAPRGPDVPGTISVVFGCLAVVMLLLCPVSGGLTGFAAAALAFVAMPAALAGRRGTRAAGFAFNLLVFLAAAAGAVLMAR